MTVVQNSHEVEEAEGAVDEADHGDAAAGNDADGGACVWDT